MINMGTKLIIASLAVISLPMNAQETYQDTKFVDNELNGTARYVGMGGAMEALGADISTINTNPAGIGLFRKSQAALSFGFVSQTGESTNIGLSANKTNASFDQAGFVWTHKTGAKSFVNFAFNYHKSRSFDQILSAFNTLDNASQNKLTKFKYDYGKTLNSQNNNLIWNAVDENYAKMLPYSSTQNTYGYYPATDYTFGQYQKGYIGEYDINMSGNINDRVYLGLTIGIHDVHYKSASSYYENLSYKDNSQNTISGEAGNKEYQKITGTGYDIKAGIIFRPIETSPFRVGLYIQSPTFYKLTISNRASTILYPDLTSTVSTAITNASNEMNGFDFRLNTPWKFGLSLGETIGRNLALGFTYEYSDYGSIDNRIITGGYYEYDDIYGDEYYENSESDDEMNHHTENTLKGVSTLKFGLEYKPLANLSLRCGYNYVSPAFEEDGYRDGTLISQGSAISASTDYTNWKATNRFTLGVGYIYKNYSFDAAYQYSITKGDFYPFESYRDEQYPDDNNIATATSVSNKRNQFLFTLGYKF